MIKDDKVLITLTSPFISYYENKGYDIESLKVNRKWGKSVPRGTQLLVNICDLPENSIVYISVICDYCGKEIQKQYREYLNSNKKGIIQKDCCDDSECLVCKRNESNLITYGCKNVFQNEEIKNKIKFSNIENYGVEFCSQIEDVKNKKENTMLLNFGYKHAAQNPKIKEKTKNTNLLKYGVEHFSKTEEYKEKIKNTCLTKYGVNHVMKVEEIKNKSIINSLKTRYENGTVPSSKQQLYLKELLGGELNYPIGNCCLDIAFPNEMIYVEYDGSGHDLRVKMGNVKQEDFINNEINRYYFLKSQGWKLIRFISINDFIPDEFTVLKVFDLAKQYLKSGHSWIKFNFENNYLECSQYKEVINL